MPRLQGDHAWWVASHVPPSRQRMSADDADSLPDLRPGFQDADELDEPHSYNPHGGQRKISMRDLSQEVCLQTAIGRAHEWCAQHGKNVSLSCRQRSLQCQVHDNGIT